MYVLESSDCAILPMKLPAAAKNAGLPCKRLEKRMEVSTGVLPISTMHLAKGLEFRAVVVMACDESVLPDAERIEGASDTSELEDIYNSERQLLYVACTRARDRLLITSSAEASEFLAILAGMVTRRREFSGGPLTRRGS